MEIFLRAGKVTNVLFVDAPHQVQEYLKAKVLYQITLKVLSTHTTQTLMKNYQTTLNTVKSAIAGIVNHVVGMVYIQHFQNFMDE